MAQSGKMMLIKKESATEGVFSTVCGLTTKDLTINNTKIDVTTPSCTAPESKLWMQSADGGISSLAISGNGLFTSEAIAQEMNAVALSDSPRGNFQVVVPGLGTYEAEFSIDTLTFGGAQDGAVTFSMALSSSGAVAFTAVAGAE